MKKKNDTSVFLLILSFVLGTGAAQAGETPAKTTQKNNTSRAATGVTKNTTAAPVAKTSGGSKVNAVKSTVAAKPGLKLPKGKTPVAKTSAVRKPALVTAKAAPNKAAIPASVSLDGKPIWLPLKAAQIAARAKHKLLLADVSTSWCHWCKVMEAKTFHDPEVEKYLAANFICAKVDAEDGADGQALAQRCEVSGFPTILVFKSSGKPIGLFEGYKPPAEFMSAIKQIPTAGPQ